MSPRAQAAPGPALTPTDSFARLACRRGVTWLDSSLSRAPDGRYSIMAAEPRWVFATKGAQWKITHADGRIEQGECSSPEPAPRGAPRTASLDRLDALLAANACSPPPTAPELPFCGGAIGWLAYDLGRQFETFNGTAQDDLGLPDIRLAWYDAAIVWDHLNSESWFVGHDGARPAGEAIRELAGWLQAPPIAFDVGHGAADGVAHSDFARNDYMERVADVRAGIARGEYYQLNLVQRFTCAHGESPAATYLRLREKNPAPFAAFLAADACAVLSSSPERFIEVTPAGRIRTCPIKGTRPRGATAQQDEWLRRELLGSAKERAELLMIVDLLRNDLGRVCLPGSVEVARLHSLETYATVHHLVGDVHGTLRRDVTRGELLRAVFPGGSITGAPKVSAMRAIDRFEPHRRGISMGAIGYFSAHGRIDLNIAIRTIVSMAGKAYVSVGAGIVWDSEPAAEYEETLVKARALFAALGVKAVAP